MGNEMLLQEILENQRTHGKKLDDLKDDVFKVSTCLHDTETKIMKQVAEGFVSKKEFPQMCRTEIKVRRKEGMEDFEQTTKFATNIWKWLGWAIAGIVVSYPVLAQLVK